VATLVTKTILPDEFNSSPDDFLQWLATVHERNRQREEERHRLESLPPEFIIHTVHGTFARSAEWIDSSRLVQWIRKRAGDCIGVELGVSIESSNCRPASDRTQAEI